MNKPVFRKLTDNTQFFKILAPDAMLIVKLEEKTMSITTTSDLVLIDASYDSENTIDGPEDEFDSVFHKAHYKNCKYHTPEIHM